GRQQEGGRRDVLPGPVRQPQKRAVRQGSRPRHDPQRRLITQSVTAAGGALTAEQAPTGPAPPRRPVCAPGPLSPHRSAGRRPGEGPSQWSSGASFGSPPMTKLIRLAAGVLCLGVLALGVVAFDPACLPTFLPRWDAAKSPSLAEAI